VSHSDLHDPDTQDALHFFGVYDGHGGAEAAKHCAGRMHHHLAEVRWGRGRGRPPASPSASWPGRGHCALQPSAAAPRC
jgi:hypothetical protein